MSTKISILYSKSLDNDFHIYKELLDGKYYLEFDNKIIQIRKSIVEKMIRDVKNGKIITLIT